MEDGEDRATGATYGPKSQGVGSDNPLGDKAGGPLHLGNVQHPVGEAKETQNPSNSLSHSAIINLKEPDHSYYGKPKCIQLQNNNSYSSDETVLASQREERAGRPVRPLQVSGVQGSSENLDTKADSFPESQNTPTVPGIALQKHTAQGVSSSHEGTGFVLPEYGKNDCESSDGVSPGILNVDLNALSHGVACRRGERGLRLRLGRPRGRGRGIVKVRTWGRDSISSCGGSEDNSKLESPDFKDKSDGTTKERTPKRKAAQKANKFLQEVASFLNPKSITRVETPTRASRPKIATPVSKYIEETDSHYEAPFGSLDSTRSSLGEDAAAGVEHRVRDCSHVSRTHGSHDRGQHSAHCVGYNHPDNHRTCDNMEEAVRETPSVLPDGSSDFKRLRIFQDDPKIFSQDVSLSEDCSLSIMRKVGRPRGRGRGRRRRRGRMLGRSGSNLGRGSHDGPVALEGNVSEHCSRPRGAVRRHRRRRCKWTWEVHKEADVLNTPQDELQGEGTTRPKRKAATQAVLFLQDLASRCPEDKVNLKLDDHPYILEETGKVRSSEACGLKAILDCLNEAAQATHSQRQINQSVEVFPKWMPYQHDWKLLGEREAKPYLPEERVSPLFEIHRENSKKHTPPRRLSRFGAVPVTEYQKDLTFFVGGPVWSLEWCPTPDGVGAIQFASVYCTRSWRATHTLDECHVEPSLLQLWFLGALQNTCCSEQQPSLAYGLALDYGCIWDMKWCPSGAWEMASSSSQEGQMSRLGLLAAGFSDGKVRIFFLPHPDSLPLAPSNSSKVIPVEPRIFKVNRFVTLEVGAVFNKEDASCGQCFSLDWMPHKGHTHLAAGFYDGSVAIWELTSGSCLLRTGTVDSCTIFPHQLFIAHNRLVSSIVWSPSNRDFLATSSHDRYIKFWDIRRVPDPVSVTQRYKSMEIAWPLQYCGTVAAQECFSKRFLQNGMLYVDFGFLGFKPHLVPAQSSSVWTVSVCNWTNILYMGDGAGSVVGTMLPNCWKEQSLYQHYIFPVYWMEKSDASGWEEADETEKFSSIWQVHEGKKGQECGEKPSEFGLTFHDTDLTSFFKHRVRDSFKRLSDQRKYESSQLDDARRKPHFAIHKVRSNPCLDSHLWLLSAGFSGLCFHGQAYKHHVLWNILVALGTCGGQLVFSGAMFSCPCKAGLNIPYSMATLVVPSLLLFLLGCGLCADTWHLLRACTHGQLSSNTWDIVGSILLSVIGRAIVAPLSWTCISLLTGTMFVCAAAESSDPTQYGFYDLFVTWKSLPEIMAVVPCPDIPLDPALQKAHFPRQAVLLSLHAKSQMYGWLLLGLCSIFIFGLMCVKACRSPRGYLQDVYRHQYRVHERSLFDQTSEQHARALAASNVKRFFGFLAMAPPKAPPTAQASGGLCVPGAVIGSGSVDVPELGLIPGEQFEVVSGLMGRCSKPWADRYYSELHYWADNSCSLGK